MADNGRPPTDSGIEARVARLESDVAHIRGDITEMRSILSRLAPVIDEVRGFLTAKLPELATKAEMADLRSETRTALANLCSETKAEFGDIRREMAELRLEIIQRPTRRQSIFDIFAVVGLIGAVLTIAARFAQ